MWHQSAIRQRLRVNESKGEKEQRSRIHSRFNNEFLGALQQPIIARSMSLLEWDLMITGHDQGFLAVWALPPHVCSSQSGISDPGGGGRYRQTLNGSFSAVSKPNFASKYSFCSIFRDLQDYTPLHRSKFKISAKFRPLFF